MRPGPRNLITDVAGLAVGHAEDHRLKSGVTALVCDRLTTASMQVLGGAPGTRDTELLDPHNTVQGVDAVFLSGGSAFGIDAGSGIQAALREAGRGFAVGPARVPIVPGVILFDLLNGGDKSWGRYPPYRELGYAAAANTGLDFALGSHGAGTGATTAGLKGGLGSASVCLSDGAMIGALVAVNALGSVTLGSSRHFRAAAFECDGEFGGFGLPNPLPSDISEIVTKMGPGPQPTATDGVNTTIAVIATDAVLSKAECRRLAVSAHDGFAQAIWPSHTPMDGDIVFALATGTSGKAPDPLGFIELCAAASACMARAIARGVYHASPAAGDLLPTYSQRFGSSPTGARAY
jgi:L-aminopeptidase/D-esterase-like protein